MPAIPKSIDDIDNEWLTGALGSEVKNFKVTFLEGGVLSDAFKIHDIEYGDSSGDAPGSVVIKMTNAVLERRAMALANNAYIKELSFFKELIDEVPIKTPIVYYLKDDGSENFEYFVIVMEDLTAHSKVFDQVDDAPNEAYSRKIVLDAAKLHAKYWESDTLQLDWLKLPNDEYVFPLDDACRGCANNIKSFVTLWEKMFGKSPFSEEDYPSLRPLTDVITGSNSVALLNLMSEKLSGRPRTLTHGDMRADNIFRTWPEVSVDDSELTYIDWQLVQPGPPGPEFTQAWQHSLHPDLRRKDLDFLKQYHDRLIELAPQAASYTYDMLVEDYKIGFVIWWMALITLGVATLPGFDQPEGARMKALWGQGLVYSFQAMHDHNCLDMVEGFLTELSAD